MTLVMEEKKIITLFQYDALLRYCILSACHHQNGEQKQIKQDPLETTGAYFSVRMIQIDQMLIVYLQLLTAWQSKFVVWAIRGMLSPTDRWSGLPPIPHTGDHPCCWGLGSWFLDNLHKLESHATLSITFHPRMKFCNNLCENKIPFESKYLTVKQTPGPGQSPISLRKSQT